MRGDRILTFLLMNPSALLAHEQVCVMCSLFCPLHILTDDDTQVFCECLSFSDLCSCGVNK